MWEKPEGLPVPDIEGLERTGITMMKSIWDKLPDDAKKALAMMALDQRIREREFKAKHIEHQIDMLKTLKTWVEKM